MEKIKFGDSLYDLVPAGASFGADTAWITALWPIDKTYEQVETAISGIDRIEIIDDAGDILAAHKGYLHLEELSKKKNYVIKRELVEDGTDPDTGEMLYAAQDTTGTVLIATLKKSDIRSELNAMKEAIDMLVVSSLEG